MAKVKESTKKAMAFLEENKTNNGYGKCLLQRAVDYSGASRSTVVKLMQKMGITNPNFRTERVKEMFADGQKHTYNEVAEKVNMTVGGAREVVLRLGLKGQIVKKNCAHWKFKNLDITKYKGYTQAELAAVLGVTADSMCRAVKMYGWAPYLRKYNQQPTI